MKFENLLYQKFWETRVAIDYVLSQGYSDNILEDDNLLQLCRRLSDSHHIIISAFPGTGKTFAYDTINGNDAANIVCEDSDSSNFVKDKFPMNYLEYIDLCQRQQRTRYHFISSHEAIREGLRNKEYDFVLIYPNPNLKQEYISRFEKRGNNYAFIKLIDENWFPWIQQCATQIGCLKIQLQKGETIYDLIKPY